MSWQELKGWSEDILMWHWEKLARELPQGARYVEVGVLFGRSIACLGTLRPDIDLWAIDMWAETVDASPGACYEEIGKEYHTTWEAFLGLMRRHAPDVLDRLHVIRAPSTSVTVPLADVVFIDADHTEDAVRADINHWRERVKDGGVLAGHDFQPDYPGVQKAVREILGEPVMGPGDWSSVWTCRNWSLR